MYSFPYYRKMSVFTGRADKHRGVIISSADAKEEEQNSSTEFGPKLASKFFAFIFVSRTPRSIGSQNGRRYDLHNNNNTPPSCRTGRLKLTFRVGHDGFP